MRHQQDAIVEATLRALTHGPVSGGLVAGPAGFPDFGKFGLAAMEAAAMSYCAATVALSWPPALHASRPADAA